MITREIAFQAAAQHAGFFSVNQCLLHRLNPDGSVRAQPNLGAECEIAWITLKPAAPGDKFAGRTMLLADSSVGMISRLR